MDVDESFRKVDRNPLEESGADSSGTKPGYWDTTDGSYKLHTAPSGLVFGERPFAPTDEATWLKHPLPCHASLKRPEASADVIWKPMSAAKLRAEAKNDMLKKKRDEKAAKNGANVGSNAALWKEAFDSDQPLAVDDVAQWYAS